MEGSTRRREAAILAALQVFVPEGQITELRAFAGRGEKATVNVLYRDLSLMAKRAAELDTEGKLSGIYFVPNRPKADILGKKTDYKSGSLKATDIERRQWLLIDVDPARPAETSATDEERNAAWDVLLSCRDILDGADLQGVVVGDSGNGWHLCYPVDLPADEASYSAVSTLLAELESRCGTSAAHVDQKPKDAPRIWKLYGTAARKGEHTSERPHRRSQLLEGSAPTQEIREANNHALANLLRAWELQRAANPARFAAAPSRSAVERARAYIEKEPVAVSGQNGSKPTFHVACILRQGFDLSEDEALEAIQDWNRRCVPPWSEWELRHKLQDAVKAPSSEPIGYLLNADRNGFTASSGGGWTAEPTSPVQAASSHAGGWRISFNDETLVEGDPQKILDGIPLVLSGGGQRHFEMRTIGSLVAKEFPPIRWVVPGVMSEGLNLLAGAPKQGKSMMSLNIALTVAGGGLALGNIRVEQQDVLYLSLEDRQRRVKSRAVKMIQALNPDVREAIGSRLTIATDWPRLDEGGLKLVELWCRKVESPGLVIIDVWNRFAPRAKGGNHSAYQQDSDALHLVKTFVDDRKMTACIVHHTRKPSGGDDADYVTEVSGTMGLTGTADGILVLLRSRQDEQARLHITGRDVSEQELVLNFAKDTLTWTSLGTAEQHVEGRVQAAVLTYLKQAGTAFVKDIVMAIGEKENSVRRALNRLHAEYLVRKVGNAWSFPGNALDGDEGE